MSPPLRHTASSAVLQAIMFTSLDIVRCTAAWSETGLQRGSTGFPLFRLSDITLSVDGYYRRYN